MGLFSDDELQHLGEQIDLHSEQIEDAQAVLEELEGVDTPQAEMQRQELENSIVQSQLQIEQIRHSMQEQGQEPERGFFND